MRVLIATNELQGDARGDYAHTVEGELVTPLASECASRERCGCNRGFPGLASGKATTTAMVVDRPGIGEDDLRDAVYDYLDRSGWIDMFERAAADRDLTDHDDECALCTALDDVDEMIEMIIDDHVDAIRDVCDRFVAGTVVERHGTLVFDRAHHRAA